ncbi:MAG: hypothetical protein ABIT69_05445 [Sphingomicrobium sp.]
MKFWPGLFMGIAATLAAGALWHGPLGAADRVAGRIEGDARIVLDNYEMPRISARLARAPLSRTLILTGPADDFQRGEIVRILDTLPGVGQSRWADAPEPSGLPLLAEAELMALIGYAIGMIFAYLLELRRRARALDRY